MSQDISGTGTVVVLKASTTFPNGLSISQFSDDSDPLDLASLQIADTAMGLNGDLLIWSKANPISLTLNVVPQSADDVNLQILGDANRVGAGKVSAKDQITATVVLPDGSIVVLNKGVLKNYMPGNSIASSQRLKTKSYVFEFESKI
jgi:hypothetical protein